MNKIASFVLILVLFLRIPVAAHAQSDQEKVFGTVDNIIEAVNSKLGGCFYADSKWLSITNSGGTNLETTTGGNCITSGPNKQEGAIRIVGNQVAAITSIKPISSTQYLADVLDNIGIPSIKQSYAQTGVGFGALTPLLPLWKSFRNFAYFVYILIFVVIGFLIMFRQKIDPQTVISVQNALPRLVITLLLITFSYAIAGILIDVMYLAIYIPVFILSEPTGEVFTNANLVLTKVLDSSVFSVFSLNPFDAEPNVAVVNAADAAGKITQNLIGDTLGQVGGILAEGLARLVFAAITLFYMVKLFVTLGVGYLKIIVSVIFAPVQILLNAFPGSQAFSKWIRSILSELAMFPAVAIIFMIAAALVGPSTRSAPAAANPWGVKEDIGYGWEAPDSTADPGWAPPFLLLRGASQGSVAVIPGLIGFFAIILSTQVATMTRDFFKVDQSPYGTAIGQAMGTGWGVVKTPYSKYRAQGQAKASNEQLARAIAEQSSGKGGVA